MPVVGGRGSRRNRRASGLVWGPQPRVRGQVVGLRATSGSRAGRPRGEEKTFVICRCLHGRRGESRQRVLSAKLRFLLRIG
jgi:hypothetical protein